jgi:hypothetical protein
VSHYISKRSISKLTNSPIRLKVIYEPLAISTNILQASHTRLDHVLVTLGNLYSIFSTFCATTDDPEIQAMANCVCIQIQKRFTSTDQDVAILAAFCNPYLRYDILREGCLSLQDVFQIANRLCRRFYDNISPCTLFLDTFYAYVNRAGEFSDEAMHLGLIKQDASNKVRVILAIKHCFRVLSLL